MRQAPENHLHARSYPARQPKRFRTYIFVGVLILGLGFCFALVIAVSKYNSYMGKREHLVSGFATVQIGSPKQSVVQMLGQPQEIENPEQLSSKTNVSKTGFEVYWYRLSMERWGVAFDRGGKVIDKRYNVSY